jgi:hypothetical protein
MSTPRKTPEDFDHLLGESSRSFLVSLCSGQSCSTTLRYVVLAFSISPKLIHLPDSYSLAMSRTGSSTRALNVDASIVGDCSSLQNARMHLKISRTLPKPSTRRSCFTFCVIRADLVTYLLSGSSLLALGVSVSKCAIQALAAV